MVCARLLSLIMVSLLLVVGTGVTAGCREDVTLAASGDATRGHVVYQRYCLSCHGEQGAGHGPWSQILQFTVPDLRAPQYARKPDAAVLQIILKGVPRTMMPGYKGRLSDQEILDVLAYLRSLAR